MFYFYPIKIKRIAQTVEQQNLFTLCKLWKLRKSHTVTWAKHGQHFCEAKQAEKSVFRYKKSECFFCKANVRIFACENTTNLPRVLAIILLQKKMNNLPENDEHLEGKDGKDMPLKRAKKKLEIKNLTESKESKTIQDEDSLENDKNDYDNFEDEEDDYDYDNYDYDEDDLGEYYYADITLQPGFSFDHLYNYKEGKCGCSKCITLAESYLNLSPLEAIVNNKTFPAFAGPLISLYQKSKKCADKSTETDEVSLVSDGT